ncbi:MAG: hypothetical protein KBE91_05945 [Bacteroidia bacterium]|nr:hypothetical protein [Bacteroidia bacterium]
MIKSFTTALLITVISTSVIAQVTGPSLTTPVVPEEKGQFSGNFQSNFQGYVKDSAIGANTTQYEKELSSADAWLFLNYKYRGLNFSLRYDMFNNTPLFDPFKAYSQSGIGFWQVTKDIEKFNITVGNFYDQFGSGIIFRAYEDRNIGIDYSVLGARVIYNPTENTQIKAFTGQQKFLFDRRTPIIKGINAEHRLNVSDDFKVDLGASFVNRTIDQVTMNNIAATINSYPLENRFDPKYNVFGYNGYTTLSYKRYRFYFEYAKKTPEALMGLDQRMFKAAGDVYYTSLSYSTKGIGISAQYRRINNFQFRTSPLETNPLPSYGALINYLPALTRQNTYRLLARYNAVMQELGENAAQIEMTFKPNKKWQINVNGAATAALSGFDLGRGVDALKWDTTTQLFREFYIDVTHKVNTKLKVMGGVQIIGYNQSTFELKANAPFVEAFTPFGEITYKLTPQRSIRIEGQYLITKQDLGNLANLLVEFNVAPHWSFSVSDMVNTQYGALNKPIAGESFKFVHYYNFFASYTYKTTRVTAAWLKQVAGVNCTGGVCRVEPAFSGARITLSTNF